MLTQWGESLEEVEQRRPLLTKVDELEVKRVALETKLQATVPSGANDLKRWDDDSLRSFVARYRSEMEFGDPESKKSIVRTLVASASLDGDDLTLVPNYPGITGVKMASPQVRDRCPPELVQRVALRRRG